MIYLEITPHMVFGRRLYIPLNAKAKALAKIAGTSSLTPEVLRIARDELCMDLVIKHAEDELMSTSASTARTVC